MLLRKLQAMKAKKGFTLIELIVVIAIIAVLAAILIPIMMNYLTNSRISNLNSDAKNIHSIVASAVTEADGRGFATPLVTATAINLPQTVANEPTGNVTFAQWIDWKLTNDLPPGLIGTATVEFVATGVSAGAPVAVLWVAGPTPATVTNAPVWNITTGEWGNTGNAAQTRTNMYGIFPG
ncbi:MAG: prepilin-type N-terminal cleavage/methylation domain-containing protein [Oscillospiraceae bacterium]|nr:prepilin-type N-terminal cleavage/methylation domain-containing protein [Oscillospiraceae bacterium]